MSTYAQWRHAADKGEVRRVTFVCGDQRVLAEEVVDTVRELVKPGELDYLPYVAGEDRDLEIWAAAHQYPLTPGAPRLVTVRSAQKLRDWKPLTGWLQAAGRALSTSHLLFVSDDPDVPYDVVAGKRVARAHIAAMKAPKGHVVRCGMPNEVDAVSWVRRRSPGLDEEMARYLLVRVGGNLMQAGAVAAKLALFERGNPGPKVIDQLTREAPADDLVTSLVAGNKRAALLAAAGIDPGEYRRVVTLLDRRLDLMSVIGRAARTGLGPREVLGHPPYLVRQFWPYARHYDERRCAQSRRVLAVVDEVLSTGARDGVLEALIALW